MTRIGLAMGSNLGDRGHLLAVARDALRSLIGPQRDFRQAPLFASAPVDCPPGSPDFLNTALEFDLPGEDPLDFLFTCQRIEARMGRPLPKDRHRNAPRPIDLDLLYLGTSTFASAELVLPHPRLTVRRFVLEPLACIAPERVPGGHAITIAAMLAALPSDDPPLRLIARDW